jgi:hypothetical protein
MIALIQILSALAPYLEQLFGTDRRQALTWTYLRSCSSDLDKSIKTHAVVDYSKNICWIVVVNNVELRVRYPINGHKIGWKQPSSVFIQWALQHYRCVSDLTDRHPRQLTHQDAKMQIKVQITLLNFKSIIFHVKASDTIASVKAKIQEKVGIPPEQHTLNIPFGQRLEDDRTLSDYSIHDGASLLVGVKSPLASTGSGAYNIFGGCATFSGTGS